MMNLSKYQIAIKDFVIHGKGDAVIEATAGSGKTTTAVMCAQLVAQSNVLMLAFNKHIAEELGRRIPEATSATIHSIGMKTVGAGLRKRLKVSVGKYPKLVRKFTRTIEDTAEQREAFKCIEALVNFSRLTLTDLRDIDAVIRMAHLYHIENLSTDYIKAARSIIEEGKNMAVYGGEIDFTDQIWLPYHLNLQPPQKYDHVFCDEAQDLNQAQLELVLKLRSPGGRILFFGDRSQAIQGFAGANTDSIDKILSRTRATQLPLSICYRCPKKHIEIAKAIDPRIEAFDGNPEGEVIEIEPHEITKLTGIGDLIVSRKTAPLVSLCLKLIASGVAARVRGRDIAAKLVGTLEEISSLPGFEFKLFTSFLDSWRDARVDKLRRKDCSESLIETITDIAECLDVCYMNFPASSVSDLASRIEGIFDDYKAAIWLSTVHRAKGLEADNVFVLEYDRFPYSWRKMNDSDYQQERNIHFVAVTRAKQKLYTVKEQVVKPSQESVTNDKVEVF